MAKGLFTQGMCVLLRQSLSIERLIEQLSGFEMVGRHDSEDEESPTTLVYQYDEEANGHLLVTLSPVRWPDDLGDPESSPERFIAWSLGQYSPYAFPGCLRRAGEQSWDYTGGQSAADEHVGHIRFLISYVLGPGEPDDDIAQDVPLMPDECDSFEELQFMMRAVEAVLDMPESICYFNPGGEILRDADHLRQALNHAWNHELLPLDVYSNVRLFKAAEQWSLMDTVGNGQFDLPDVEAIFKEDDYEPIDVQNFLRSATMYLISGEDEVENGDTADGPGNIQWQVMECADGLSDPPRETIRWFPQDESSPPLELLDPGMDDEEDFDEEAIADDEDDDELDIESCDY